METRIISHKNNFATARIEVISGKYVAEFEHSERQSEMTLIELTHEEHAFEADTIRLMNIGLNQPSDTLFHKMKASAIEELENARAWHMEQIAEYQAHIITQEQLDYSR